MDTTKGIRRRILPAVAAAVWLAFCGQAPGQVSFGPEFEPGKTDPEAPTSERAPESPGTLTGTLTGLPQPGPRAFILDQAVLIQPADREKIRQLADKLLTEKATPIIVVTIDSMARHGGAGMRIETFARLLFDQWQIGQARVNNKTWNTGILLLVSKGDRKARIELGAGWKRDKDDQALDIMDNRILPPFKAGDYSAGILAGVEALDKMARGLELPAEPAVPRPTWHYVVGAIAVGLGIFTIASMVRRGTGGWAWLFWGVVLGLVGMILYSALSNSGRSGGGGGGGFSGGSFGGGSSGGGGASGSW